MTTTIDLEKDTVVPINDLCRKTLGKRISPATQWRWIRKGVRGGIKLEAIQAAGVWCSTPAAFARFLTAQTHAALESSESPAERSEETARKLREAGVL